MHEEDSNSLNAKLASLESEALDKTLSIQAIENLKGARREQVRIRLSDGSFFYLLKDLFLQAGLYKEAEITYREAAKLITQSEQLEIKRKALELVATVRHSRAGLRLKLLKKGYKPALLDTVLDELTELGYLDDEAFAREWLQFRIKKHPEGKQALLAGLQKKGIERSVAERTVRDILNPETELENVIRTIAKLTRFRQLDEPQLIAKLYAKGFSYDLIKKALKRLAGKDEEDL